MLVIKAGVPHRCLPFANAVYTEPAICVSNCLIKLTYRVCNHGHVASMLLYKASVLALGTLERSVDKACSAQLTLSVRRRLVAIKNAVKAAHVPQQVQSMLFS